MNPDLSISVITATHNRLDLTQAFVQSLQDYPHPSLREIIFCDNGSKDGTPQWLEKLPSPFLCHLAPQNAGYAAANNLGASRARAPWLLFCNNDLVLKDDWLTPMLELAGKPGVGAVGNVQRYPGNGLIDHAGIAFNLEGLPFHVRKNRRRTPKGSCRERNAVTGACLLISSALFHSLGGFDQDFRNGMEDVDLCVRIRLAGKRILVSHQSQIGHWVGQSPGRHQADADNTRRFLEKWQAVTRAWGRREWPREYFSRYARHWWKMHPKLCLLALSLLTKDRFAGGQ